MYLLVLSTVPDQTTAERIAALLVESKLAACVNIMPQLTSIYSWQDKLVTDSECLLLIKTLETKYEALAKKIQQEHPYSIPEIIALPIIQGTNNYFAWLAETLN